MVVCPVRLGISKAGLFGYRWVNLSEVAYRFRGQNGVCFLDEFDELVSLRDVY